jgi:nucleoside-diphosphate-sugar epimerase
MKVLFIGGTGNISTAVSTLAVARGIDLYLLQRGRRQVAIPGAHALIGDITQPEQVAALLAGQTWDAVVNWIAFTPADIERDLALFQGKTAQYIFISSASVYQRPLTHPIITESTPLTNPYWPYSRNKIACEDRLTRAFRDDGFPMTIVRPAHTYDTVIPVAIGGWEEYTLIDRLKRGENIIVHGDGSSLWTLTHSEDFAKGFVGLLGHQQALGHAFHITSDELLTWNQIYEAVAAAAGTRANIVHIPSDFIGRLDPAQVGNLIGDKATSAIFDNGKIKRFVSDFTATIPFSQGIKRTLAWFEADPVRMVVNPETNAMMDKIINAYERAYDNINQ